MSHRAGSARIWRNRRPEPGSYDIPVFPGAHPSSLVTKAAAYSVGVDRQPVERLLAARLGPGSYHPKPQVLEKNEVGGSFERQSREGGCPRPEKTPAPSLVHRDNPKFRTAPNFSFATADQQGLWEQQTHHGRGARMPGPGEHCPYDGETSGYAKMAGPAYSIAPVPKVVKPRQPPKPVPGPGAYNREDRDRSSSLNPAAPRTKIGTAQRVLHGHPMGPSHRNSLVGPGRYDGGSTRTGHSSFGGSAPRWTMRGRGETDMTGGFV